MTGMTLIDDWAQQVREMQGLSGLAGLAGRPAQVAGVGQGSEIQENLRKSNEN